MPARQPFTNLCQQTARGSRADRADLHLHTHHSDGLYSPSQIVDLARRCGLAALAITDHDTMAGVPFAQQAASTIGIDIIPGVEITSEFGGRELHLLAYFVHLEDAPLAKALDQVRRHRRERYREMVERLEAHGVSFHKEAEVEGRKEPEAVGRRHLAEALVRAGKAADIRDAFLRYLGDGSRFVVPKQMVPVAEALALVRGAGGVSAWAHPPRDCDRAGLVKLRDLGLSAVEVEYPDMRPGRVRQLRTWAAELGLAVSGGSDCHGPGQRCVGARTISLNELAALRDRSSNWKPKAVPGNEKVGALACQ